MSGLHRPVVRGVDVDADGYAIWERVHGGGVRAEPFGEHTGRTPVQ
jgi:hypothetical protein